ncbi:MAG: MarR family winged helix-turn-helix transcriptional regulator [Bacteroidia bacterium]
MKPVFPKEFHFHYSLANLLGRSYPLIIKRLTAYLKEKKLPISADQFRILTHLWEKDGCSQQTLANLSHRNRANITRHIDSMENLGLLRREQDKNDRRIYRVFLMDAGHELEIEAIKCAKQALTDATQNIDEAELSICLKVIQQTIDNLS